jgi:hypothetical protein
MMCVEDMKYLVRSWIAAPRLGCGRMQQRRWPRKASTRRRAAGAPTASIDVIDVAVESGVVDCDAVQSASHADAEP